MKRIDGTVIIIGLLILSFLGGIWVREEIRQFDEAIKKDFPQIEVVYVEKPIIDIEHPVCSSGTFKSWMDYNTVTAPSSDQYKLKSQSTTNLSTGIREYKGHLLVAMAAPYGPVGTTYEITFESNQTIKVIMGDIKADTDCEHSDGSMIEFIVDKNLMSESIRDSGNFNQMFVGPIVSIKE